MRSRLRLLVYSLLSSILSCRRPLVGSSGPSANWTDLRVPTFPADRVTRITLRRARRYRLKLVDGAKQLVRRSSKSEGVPTVPQQSRKEVWAWRQTLGARWTVPAAEVFQPPHKKKTP